MKIMTVSEWNEASAKWMDARDKLLDSHKGSFWCRHKDRCMRKDEVSIPTGIRAQVKYPFGTVYESIGKSMFLICVKCGKMWLTWNTPAYCS